MATLTEANETERESKRKRERGVECACIGIAGRGRAQQRQRRTKQERSTCYPLIVLSLFHPSALLFPPHCQQLALLLHFVSASVCLSCLFCFDPLILSGCLAGIRIRNSQFAFVALFLLLFLFPLPLHAVRPPQTDRQQEGGRERAMLLPCRRIRILCLSRLSFHAPSSLSFSGFVYKHLMDH